jgi:hypothetical protein
VTPSAWGGSAKVLELPNGTFLLNYSNSSQAIVGANAYYTGSNWLYKNTAAASNYEQNAGLHAWFTAPSGTAGNAITFTQAMTLDANGNLGIGTSSPDSGFQLTAYADVAGAIRVRGGGAGSNSARTASLSLLSSGNEEWIVRGANDSLRFLQSSTERARIASGGDLLVGTTSGAITVNGLKFLSDGSFYAVQNSGVTSSIYNKSNYTSGTDFFADFRLANTTVGSISANGSTTSYTTSSDRRLKENIAPAADAGAVVDAIEVVQHDWKVGGHTRYGMIAQDLHAVAPEAVTAGDDGDEIEKTWGVDYSKLVPMLIKEIQSLRARVAALESN